MHLVRLSSKCGLRTIRCYQWLAVAQQRNASDTSKSTEVKIPLVEVRPFIERALTHVGAKQKHAEAVADSLFAADFRGHFSHGLQRADIYVNELRSGVTSTTNEPRIEREHGAATLVDGGNVLGAHVGNFCMDIAVRKAKKHGVAFVSARNSNHYGICAFYTLQAVEQGLIVSLTSFPQQYVKLETKLILTFSFSRMKRIFTLLSPLLLQRWP